MAVAFTMPSVGRSLVGRRKCSNSARSAFGAWPGAERSTAKFLVAIRLVSVRTGFTPAGKFRRDDSERVGFALDHLRGAALGAELIRERLLERRIPDERCRQPHARHSGRLQDFDARRHFERAPTFRWCGLGKQAPRIGERETGAHNAGRSQEITTLHNLAPSARMGSCTLFEGGIGDGNDRRAF